MSMLNMMFIYRYTHLYFVLKKYILYDPSFFFTLLSYYAQLSCTTVAQMMWSSSFPTDADFGFAGVPGPSGGHRVLTCSLHCHAPWRRRRGRRRGAGLERKTTSASSSHSRTSTSVSPAPTICYATPLLQGRLVCDLYTYTPAAVGRSSIPIPPFVL